MRLREQKMVPPDRGRARRRKQYCLRGLQKAGLRDNKQKSRKSFSQNDLRLKLPDLDSNQEPTD